MLKSNFSLQDICSVSNILGHLYVNIKKGKKLLMVGINYRVFKATIQQGMLFAQFQNFQDSKERNLCNYYSWCELMLPETSLNNLH